MGALARQLTLDRDLITHEDDLEPVLAGGAQGAGDVHRRAAVPAHRIDGDSHGHRGLPKPTRPGGARE